MTEAEALAIFDDQGRRIGEKTRAQVHRDHDWHWLVFVWAAHRNPAGEGRTLLQVRSRPSDPFLGSVDAPAAGHVLASETHLEGAIREFREEAGVEVAPEDLLYLEERPLENQTGFCRRVRQHFYLCRKPVGLDDVCFNEEVSGFVEVGLEDLSALLQGDRDSVTGQFRLAGEPDYPQYRPIGADAFAAYSEAIVESFRRSMRTIRAVL